MSLIGLLVMVIVIGLLLYLVNLIPLQPPWLKTVAHFLIVLVAILWLLGAIDGGPVLHLER